MRKLLLSLIALAGLALGGAVVAQTIGGVSNGYIEEGNLLRSGNIIKTITMSNRGQDATTCRKACDADSNCYAYTYLQEKPNRKPICYLRMIALPSPQTTRSHGYTRVISGTKLSYLPDVQNLKPYPGRAIQGGTPLRSFKVFKEDPIECSRACAQDGNCASFTYKPRTTIPKSGPAMCTLHSKNGSLTAQTQAGYLSGSKTALPIPRKSRLPSRSSNPTIIDRGSQSKQPIIKRPGQTITIPDQTERDENPALSDDDDAQFPGEMLDPGAR